MTVISKFNRFMIFAICLSCFVFNAASAQTKKFNCSVFKDTLLHKIIYKQADIIPEPEGGMAAVSRLIAKELKYPSGDSEYIGKIIIAFVIEPNGKIDGKRIIKDPSGKGQLLSKQLFKIIDEIKWTPAFCKGKAVPFLYSIPVNINLEEWFFDNCN
ncbi:energy transducer TonB [Mucilaginibacter sp. BJC16-A38]|uniref:energy transducer TonB n=1 Tax=Mucilaginibacter phenanthrenivorans TaxID=1234842 RepID=UPI00215790C3|nr:energy transducer TonB [Mucilaginibacter phenanthrenivorans]MCR8561634.1 energy transducer TonB [Mucilaginibacter phenanthrenivorans]